MLRSAMNSGYENRNDCDKCVCGDRRSDVENRIWYVGEHGGFTWAPYYYQCPACHSFSAINLRFAPESYAACPIEAYSIPELKRELNRQRVGWIMERAPIPRDAVIYDLGAGEGAFTQAFVQALPSARVSSVEADARMPAKFFAEYAGATIVTDYIEQFLHRPDVVGSADVVVLTDVLEHVVDPSEVLSLLMAALKPGGFAYITAPNSESLVHRQAIEKADIPWDRANATYQHLWAMEPGEMLRLVSKHGHVMEFSRSFETAIRQDSEYSTFLIRR